MEIGYCGFGDDGGENDDGSDPKIEGDHRQFDGKDVFAMRTPFIDESECPGCQKRTQQEGNDAG